MTSGPHSAEIIHQPPSCFPISAGATEAIGDLLWHEGFSGEWYDLARHSIEAHNPGVIEAVTAFSDGWGLESEMVVGIPPGMIATYKLVERQASLNDVNVPRVDPDPGVVQRLIEALSLDISYGSAVELDEYFQLRHQQLITAEPDFSHLVSKVFQGLVRGGSNDRANIFRVGALITYDVLQKQERNDHMKQHFDF
ncbi:hypothetical protein COY17_01555 [Candidatus Saccharibacteria bacterium CG_4_10_14_0_2_um_filter_52_9]|nr:MAG: hypothetical protein COY17_01555 [Candidatus Saccharibacteria bacterium CG_4_10_14_0_2_um_filter_52_9]